MAGYIPGRFTCPRAVTHPSSNRAQCRLTALIELDVLTTTLRRHSTQTRINIQFYRPLSRWNMGSTSKTRLNNTGLKSSLFKEVMRKAKHFYKITRVPAEQSKISGPTFY